LIFLLKNLLPWEAYKNTLKSKSGKPPKHLIVLNIFYSGGS